MELCLPAEGENEPRATAFYVGPWQNRNLFKALSMPFNRISAGTERQPG